MNSICWDEFRPESRIKGRVTQFVVLRFSSWLLVWNKIVKDLDYLSCLEAFFVIDLLWSIWKIDNKTSCTVHVYVFHYNSSSVIPTHLLRSKALSWECLWRTFSVSRDGEGNRVRSDSTAPGPYVSRDWLESFKKPQVAMEIVDFFQNKGSTLKQTRLGTLQCTRVSYVNYTFMAVIVEVFLLSSRFCVGLLEIWFSNWSSWVNLFTRSLGN